MNLEQLTPNATEQQVAFWVSLQEYIKQKPRLTNISSELLLYFLLGVLAHKMEKIGYAKKGRDSDLKHELRTYFGGHQILLDELYEKIISYVYHIDAMQPKIKGLVETIDNLMDLIVETGNYTNSKRKLYYLLGYNNVDIILPPNKDPLKKK